MSWLKIVAGYIFLFSLCDDQWVIQRISIPYHGWREHFNPPCLWKFQNTLPPCAPNSKSINPSSTLEFWIFSDPLEFLFDCLKVLTNRKLALFPPFKKMRQLKFVINVYSTL